MSDRFSLAFDERDEDGTLVGSKELPMTIAILGDFSPSVDPADDYYIADSVIIEQKTFDLVFTKLTPAVQFETKNHLHDNGGFMVSLAFSYFADFHPNSYLKQVSELKDYEFFIRKLGKLQGNTSVYVGGLFNDVEIDYLSRLDKKDNITKDSTLNIGQIIRYLALAKEAMNLQVNEIIYAPELQQLEHSWTGVNNLANFTALIPSCKIVLLHTHKSLLEEDIISRAKVTESDLFYQVYTKELDQFGGEPVNMILNTFVTDKEDQELLSAIGDVAKVASCPIISTIDADFLELDDVSLVENGFDFEDYRKTPAFSSFGKISKDQKSRFLGFVLSKIKLRDKYISKDINIFLSLKYIDEHPNDYVSGGLWGTSVFLFATIFLQFFAKYGHCSGVDDGINNRVSLDKFSKKNKVRLNWSPATETQKELANFGIMSFRYLDCEHSIVGLGSMNMFNINSIQDAGIDLAINERINVHLPQLLFIAQLHHYLRLIQRQSYARDDHKSLKKELLDWLKQYVSDAYMTDSTVRMYKPLKSVDLKMNTDKGAESGMKRLQFGLSITPHSPYRGLEYSVSL